MLSEIAKKYHAEHKGNCAESVAYAYASTKKFSSEKTNQLLATMKSCGGGRSPNGLCGALHAALYLSNETEKEFIQEYFKIKTGGKIHCKDIRPTQIISCNQCVELAAKALEEISTPNTSNS